MQLETVTLFFDAALLTPDNIDYDNDNLNRNRRKRKKRQIIKYDCKHDFKYVISGYLLADSHFYN